MRHILLTLGLAHSCMVRIGLVGQPVLRIVLSRKTLTCSVAYSSPLSILQTAVSMVTQSSAIIPTMNVKPSRKVNRTTKRKRLFSQEGLILRGVYLKGRPFSPIPNFSRPILVIPYLKARSIFPRQNSRERLISLVPPSKLKQILKGPYSIQINLTQADLERPPIQLISIRFPSRKMSPSANPFS